MPAEDAYSQAVASGRYVRETGLHGKYDNVRVFWEDEVTRLFLVRHLEPLVRQRLGDGKGIRILDLGCGSGDGFELVIGMDRETVELSKVATRLIGANDLEQYRGIELNQDLLAQNVERWGEDPRMVCTWGDFSKGLPIEPEEPSFDLYLASYGTLSHLTEDQTVGLLCDIVEQAEDGALILTDWLGRYSYEWQELWDEDLSQEQWMDYVISYIYPADQRGDVELASLDLRLLSRDESERVFGRVEAETGARLEVKDIFDRSVFVGRHMDTADYNPYLKPLRQAVNSLLERNVRTDLESLLIDYHPHPQIAEPNGFFGRFQFAWNSLVRHAIALCEAHDTSGSGPEDADPTDPEVPEALTTAMAQLGDVVRHVGSFDMGDPRANVIEPQLAYGLRGLEMSMQEGKGNGHGLVAICEVRKA